VSRDAARPSSSTSSSKDVAATRKTVAVGLEDVAVARKILITNAAVLAFVPVGSGVETWPVMVRLGRALHTVAGSTLGLVRAPDLWVPGGDGGQAPVLDGSFQVREVEGSNGLSELVIPAATTLHEACNNLARVAEKASGGFGHLLIDLAGFLPEVREVLEFPDAFVSAAVAGRTRERELRAVVELLPTSRHLGTLLLDH
jgi:hypothetical protein